VVVDHVATLISLAGIFPFSLSSLCILDVYFNIMLLQSLSVIDICLILIYSLYQKNAMKSHSSGDSYVHLSVSAVWLGFLKLLSE
jgi:hypothetical protein